MASYAAQLLDELMGRNRNVNPDEKASDIRWDSPEVCKYFLCGFCPNDLFVNTKADLGTCGKMHDDVLRDEYQKSSRFQKAGYEEDWVRYLESLIQDVDRRIKRGQQRLIPGAGGISGAPTDEKSILLSQRINDLVEQAEKLGCEGKVDEAQIALKQADQLRREQRQIENANGNPFDPPPLKQMEVCSVCGAFLIVGDAESRQREHLLGKQHVGYAQVRTTLEDWKEQKRQREDKIRAEREEREKERERERDGKRKREEEQRSRRSRSKGKRRSHSKDRQSVRNKDRHRSRSKDRHRSKSKDRHRSKSRDHHSSKSKDLHDSKSKDRHGSKSKDQHMSKSKERHRSKSVDRHHSKSKDQCRSRSKDTGHGSKDGRRSGVTTSSHSNSRDRKKRSRSKETRSRDGAQSSQSKDVSRKRSRSRDAEKSKDNHRSSKDKDNLKSSRSDCDKEQVLKENGNSDSTHKATDQSFSALANGETKEVDAD